MITRNYNEAVEQAVVLNDYQGQDPDIAEKLVLLGYIAALQDNARIMNESVSAATARGKAGRMYTIAQDKLSRLGRSVMERAGELKV